MDILIVGAVIWTICGLVGGAITSGRGHSFGSGCALGVLFSPLGVLIAAVIALQPAQTTTNSTQFIRDRNRRPCPHCAELILLDAKVCRFCGREVEPLLTPTGVAPVVISDGNFVRCPNCNTKNYLAAEQCEKCGIRFLEPIRKKTTSAVEIHPVSTGTNQSNFSGFGWAVIILLVVLIIIISGTILLVLTGTIPLS